MMAVHSAPAPALRNTAPVLGLLLLAAACLAGWWIAQHGPPGFDDPVIAALAGFRDHAGFWLAVTALGDGWFRIALLLPAAGWLLLSARRRDALLLLAASGGEMLVNSALKQLFARARPDLLTHLDPVSSYSYPSGHAAHSTTLYLLLALLLAPRAARPLAVGAAALLAGAIGLSRIILGVHWPSDVIGGWAVGLSCVLAAWAFARPRRLHD